MVVVTLLSSMVVVAVVAFEVGSTVASSLQPWRKRAKIAIRAAMPTARKDFMAQVRNARFMRNLNWQAKGFEQTTMNNTLAPSSKFPQGTETSPTQTPGLFIAACSSPTLSKFQADRTGDMAMQKQTLVYFFA